MKTKYNKAKKSKENVVAKTLPPSPISNEEEIANNLNKSLEGPFHNEYSDEEWLKSMHRILDDRSEYRNLRETIDNINTR